MLLCHKRWEIIWKNNLANLFV